MSLSRKLHLWGQRREAKKDADYFQANRGEFYEDLASALGDGVGIAEHLKSVASNAEKRQPRLSRAVHRILNSMVGKDISQGLKGFAPEIERIIIASGIKAGTLEDDLRFAGENALATRDMVSNIRSAMFMPMLTLAISWANVWLVSSQMLPMVDELISAEKISGGLFVFYWFCYLVSYTSLLLVVIVCVLAYRFYKRLPSWTGAKRRKVDNYFPFSIYRDMQGAMFLMSLGALLRSGSGLKEAIESIRETSTPWMRWHCSEILNRLNNNPLKPGLAFDTGILSSRMINRMIEVAERAKFHDFLKKYGISAVKQTGARIYKLAVHMEVYIGVLATGIMLVITVALPPLLEATLSSAMVVTR